VSKGLQATVSGYCLTAGIAATDNGGNEAQAATATGKRTGGRHSTSRLAT
jgi:hypothetical protein